MLFLVGFDILELICRFILQTVPILSLEQQVIMAATLSNGEKFSEISNGGKMTVDTDVADHHVATFSGVKVGAFCSINMITFDIFDPYSNNFFYYRTMSL